MLISYNIYLQLIFQVNFFTVPSMLPNFSYMFYLQFRALADQIFRNPDYHRHVRKAVVKQVNHHFHLFIYNYLFFRICGYAETTYLCFS
jgi:hypothetical protein